METTGKAIGRMLLVGLVTAAGAATASAQDATAAAREDAVRSELRDLEAAARHNDLPPQVDPKRYRDVTRRAHEFAKTVGGTDNRKYLQALQGALEGGLAAELDVDRQEIRRFAQPLKDKTRDRLMDMLDRAGFDPTASTGSRALAVTAAPGAGEFASTSRRSIQQNPTFQTNLRKLNEDSAKEDSDLIPADFFFRIVSGMPDGENRFPFCVAVGGSGGYCCTGTLVGRNVVLTAGHCFPCIRTGTRVFVGPDINKPGREYRGQVFRHKDYGQGGLHNDLCVVVLDEDVPDVQPCSIASADVIETSAYVRAVGYGTVDVAGTQGFGTRRYVDLPVASTHCGLDGDGTHFGCDSGLELVAGMVGLNADTCKGDSGGPILVRRDNQWYLVGATSRATQEATRMCGDGGIFVRADKYVDWMRSVPGTHWQ